MPSLVMLRRGRDSNSWYGNPYVSLANWWFQPLTHLSKGSGFRFRIHRTANIKRIFDIRKNYSDSDI